MSDAILVSGPLRPAVPEGWSATELAPGRYLLVRTGLPVQPRVYRGVTKTVVVLGEPHINPAAEALLRSDAFPGTTAGALGEWSEGYTGHFAVLAIHHDSGAVVYVTDLMEAIPVYRAELGESVVVGTHVDAVAQVAGRDSVDPASVLDFLISGTIAPPATWFQGVAVAAAAAVAVAEPGSHWREQLYWTPDEAARAPFASLAEAAEALAALMDDNVRLALDGRERAGALVSGGEDSRVIVGLAKRHREQLDGVTFLERMNREGRLARSAMKALGCSVRLCPRERDYYLRHLPLRRALVGSGLDVRHTHAVNLLPTGEWDVVLGGLFADTLFKADKARYEPARHVRNVRVSKNRLSPDQGFGWPRSAAPELFKPELFDEVESRRRRHFDALQQHRPGSAYGWRTVWPAGACHGSLPHFAACRRLVNMQEPFAYNNTVAFAASLPDAMKLEGELYRRAFTRAMGLSGWIPRISGRVPRLGFYPNIVCTVGFAAWAKTVDRLKGGDGAWEGPWPSFSYLMNNVLDRASLSMDQGAFGAAIPGVFREQPDVDALLSDRRMDNFAKHRLLQLIAAPDSSGIG
ncbi:asparagine synthase-related protein [Aquisalimonas asiatica]|uniref:asparagine synthase (glutamine-hydrolyzing) n=1 Tax=Aquisalimonas asiatica TaxID=406100 RepID=A0A1H8U4I4_9GAMM|nr:asparagine synthase-related protein [Aquisalimonas asiatica]SEO97976.1 Asparagine synthase [Aquisalimonas asiatica]